jgi:hypothetical protein
MFATLHKHNVYQHWRKKHTLEKRGTEASDCYAFVLHELKVDNTLQQARVNLTPNNNDVWKNNQVSGTSSEDCVDE